jgi:hypothetical protein
VADARARKIRAQHVHRVDHRDRGRGARDRDEQRCEEIADLQAHLVGQRLHRREDRLALPGRHALEAPLRELQQLRQRLALELHLGEALFRERQHARGEVGRGGREIAQALHARLQVRQHAQQVLAVVGPGDHAVGELLEREVLADPQRVQPAQLVEVEHRPAQRDAHDVEMAQHLAQRELLALVGHRPAHAAEVVEQRLGQVTHAPVVQDAGRVLALDPSDLNKSSFVQQSRLSP